MDKLLGFGVKNLRSLEDTGLVKVKPLTILVGRNSAGKSTFARTIPLLRQTSMENKREPILWWGNLVDFGSFAESVNKKCLRQEIEFDFELEMDSSSDGMIFETSNYFIELPDNRTSLAKVGISIAQSAAGKLSEHRSISIKMGNDSYGINFEAGKVASIEINNYKWIPNSSLRQTISLDSLIPTLEFHQPRRIAVKEGEVQAYVRHDPHINNVLSFVRNASFFHGNSSRDAIVDVLAQLDPGTPENLLATMKSVINAPQTWKLRVAILTTGNYDFIRFRNLLLAVNLNGILRSINRIIVGFVTQSTYLEPLRATAERYYRKQSLSVAEVDSKGANVPFFFDSLSQFEKNRFNEWMQEHLNASISAESEGGHLSLKLKDSSGIEANLADVGFGFSQVLPIALQLWHSADNSNSSTKRNTVRSTVVIEQPELHLHPEYQAKLADLFVSAIEKAPLNLIIETHSSSIINRLGILISKKRLDPESVQILRFERQEGDFHTTVKKSEFSEKGQLKDWPYGFFDA
ncbi:DUF3696 domain-containing protein [Acidovorax sp. Root219]|uniref:DUF3696 domain-containing protein n=1 Tax=Acidovorax sp. Root219 TaxID=1736493 RepID=UPI0009EB0E5C|nr:DUF3696 domain-containing protein [Acidovorax sp. Root219]